MNNIVTLEKRLEVLEDKLSRTIQIGTVIDRNPAQSLLLLQMQDLSSTWMPYVAQRAGDDKSAWLPDNGEQLTVFAPFGDIAQAFCKSGLFSSDNPSPITNGDEHKTVYKDGTEITYNRAAHTLDCSFVGDVTINIAGNCDLNCEKLVTIDGAEGVKINQGTGVVTAQSICAFTGRVHFDESTQVTAGK